MVRLPLAATTVLVAVALAASPGAPPALAGPPTGSPSAPPAATAPAAPAGPVGGAALGTRGVALDAGPGAPRLPRPLSARAWLVADLDTGEVLAARDPHGRYLPASTLKILTAVTLLPRLDPDRTIVASDAAASVDGTRVGLVPRFGYRVRDLFTAMLVMSANDAAHSLAEAYGGVPRTVRAMNAEAHRLNAADTLARTPHGLDAPGQVTSAYDLALLARAGLASADFRHYVGTVSARFPAPRHRHYEIYTHDPLLLHYRGAIGVKDGYTVAARASFVGAATRGGHTLVVTLLRANPYPWHEAARLLDWGFAARGRVRPVGTLVRPGPLAAPAAAPSAGSGTAPAGTGAAPAGGEPGRADTGGSARLAAPIGAGVGAAILAAAWGRSRLRRRRRYGRRKPLTLPR